MEAWDKFEALSAYRLVRALIVGWLLGFALQFAISFWLFVVR